MKRRRRYTDDQIVSILQEHSGGVTAAEVIRRHGISLDTLYRWKRKYRGVDKVELQRLKALEQRHVVTGPDQLVLRGQARHAGVDHDHLGGLLGVTHQELPDFR